MKVLIIDDLESKARSIERCFNNLNITDVSIEATRNTGLISIETQIKNGTPYDLIVCDMQMPNMINGMISPKAGLHVLHSLSIRKINTPVIMCSSDKLDDLSEYENVIGSIHYNYSVDHTSDIEKLLKSLSEK